MSAGRVFALLLSMAFGLALAGAVMGPWLKGTPLEEFAPPPGVFAYQPSPVTGIIGDFVWAIAVAMHWFGRLPAMAAALLTTFSVPYPLNALVTIAVAASLAAFVIYIVSGRAVHA